MPSHHRPILLLILALALIRGLIYASLVPPWQAPDEPAQFERAKAAYNTMDWQSTPEEPPTWHDSLARSLFTFGFWNFNSKERPPQENLPLNQYTDLYQEIYDGLYSSRPAFAILGWPLPFVSRSDIVLQLYAARLASVLLNLAILALGYKLALLLFPNDDFIPLGVPILILFNVQHTHILASVNNGNLAELLALAALYFMTVGVLRGFRPTIIAAAIGCTLAAMWVKATAYFLPVVLGAVAFILLWRFRRHWRWILPAILILGSATLILVPERLILLLREGLGHVQNGTLQLNPVVPGVMFGSFWALPGWLTLQLDRIWYQLWAAAVALSFLGLGILFIRQRRRLGAYWHNPQTQAMALLLLAILVAVSIPLLWSAITGTVTYRQGRSIFPVIVPIAIFLLLGWRSLLPRSWRPIGLLSFTSLAFLFDTLVLFLYIVPFFYTRVP